MADERPGGPPALVADLYATYGDRMYRYALMLTTDHARAADVVHDVFRAVLDARPPMTDPLAFLRRAVRNRAISLFRAACTHGEVPLEQALLEPAVAQAPSPVDRLALEQALRDLPVEQREVVHLHAFEGMTFQEVAHATDVSINTAAARYRYALDRLRRALGTATASRG